MKWGILCTYSVTRTKLCHTTRGSIFRRAPWYSMLLHTHLGHIPPFCQASPLLWLEAPTPFTISSGANSPDDIYHNLIPTGSIGEGNVIASYQIENHGLFWKGIQSRHGRMASWTGHHKAVNKNPSTNQGNIVKQGGAHGSIKPPHIVYGVNGCPNILSSLMYAIFMQWVIGWCLWGIAVLRLAAMNIGQINCMDCFSSS